MARKNIVLNLDNSQADPATSSESTEATETSESTEPTESTETSEATESTETSEPTEPTVTPPEEQPLSNPPKVEGEPDSLLGKTLTVIAVMHQLHNPFQNQYFNVGSPVVCYVDNFNLCQLQAGLLKVFEEPKAE